MGGPTPDGIDGNFPAEKKASGVADMRGAHHCHSSSEIPPKRGRITTTPPPLSHSTQQFPSPTRLRAVESGACPACGKEEDKIRRRERRAPSIALIQKWRLAKEEEASPGKRGKEGGGIKKRFAPLPPPPPDPSFPSGVAGEREEDEKDRKDAA